MLYKNLLIVDNIQTILCKLFETNDIQPSVYIQRIYILPSFLLKIAEKIFIIHYYIQGERNEKDSYTVAYHGMVIHDERTGYISKASFGADCPL
ncbi:MAG: hypothetical protein Kow00108_10720 [Calditrichia bacterium]